MREILFKAKRIDNGEWVDGHYYKMSETTYCFKEDYKRNPVQEHHYILQERMTDWGLPNQMVQIEIDPKTLCQFTGMTDKNGKRIWENDIVEAWSQGSRAIGTVKQRVDGLWIMSPAWQNHEFWELKPNSNGETTVEVLVNAFDNPELLQEEHK